MTVFIRGNTQGGLIAGGPPSSSGGMSSTVVNGVWVIHQSIQYGETHKLCVARGKAPRGGKLSSKAEGHSEVGSSVPNNQELTVVYGLTC